MPQDTALVSEGGWAKRLPAPVRSYAMQLETLARFAAQQAAGRPTGPHAAFKPAGVDAVTLRLVMAHGKVSVGACCEEGPCERALPLKKQFLRSLLPLKAWFRLPKECFSKCPMQSSPDRLLAQLC